MPTLTFLNGALLAALVAIAGPLVIHLISRRKLPEIRIASTWLLREARRENLRHVKLHDYLLLVLRTLAVAFVVLAAARPALRAAGALATGGGESAVAVVLDATASMQATVRGGLVFDHARRRAEEIVRQTGRGDVVTLYVARGRGPAAAGDVVTGRTAVLAALRAASPGLGAGALGPSVAEAVRRVTAERKPNREVYVVSDFQRPAVADIGRDVTGVPAGVRLVLAPPGAPPRGNLALEGAAVEAGGRVRVTVANHSPEAVTVPVRVEAVGDGSAEAAVLVPGGSRGTALVRDPLAGRGAAAGGGGASVASSAGEMARLPADALAPDNVRYFLPAARSVVRVLLVARPAGAVSTPAGIAPAAFPRLALEAGGPLGPGPTFAVDEGGAARLLEVDPSRTDVVLLADPPRLPRAALRALAAYRARGGAVFLALGPESEQAGLGSELLPAVLAGAPGARIAVRGRVGQGAPGGFLTLVPTAAGHPVFAGFRLSHGGALTGARFRQAVALEARGTAQVLARFSDGTPALVEAPGLFVFASSLDLAWGDFPTTGAFLPFLRQSAAYLATGRARPDAEHVAGEPLTVLASPGVTAGAVRCAGPGGRELAVTGRVEGTRQRLLTEPVPEPGIWTLRSGDRFLGRYAVNLDARESDLARPSVGDLVRTFGRPQAVYVRPGDRVGAVMGRLRHGREIWRPLLAVALALLLAELWLGRTRGRVDGRRLGAGETAGGPTRRAQPAAS